MNWFTKNQGEQLLAASEKDPYKRINKKIQWLKKIDEHHEIYGSMKHHYRTHKTIKASAIEAAEQRLNLIFPESYKLFLTQVTNGGVGPNLGLLSFEESLAVYEAHKVWPVSNEGLGHLIVLGPFESHKKDLQALTDEVWLDSESVGEGTRQLFKKGEIKTFLVWYEEWLDHAMEFFILRNVF